MLEAGDGTRSRPRDDGPLKSVVDSGPWWDREREPCRRAGRVKDVTNCITDVMQAKF